MGFVKRRVSGDYFGGSSLIVPGQGVYSIKKYNNFVGKSGIKKDNYDDIPLPTPTPTPTMTNTPTPTMTNTPTPTPTPSGKVKCNCFNFIYEFGGRRDDCTSDYLSCDGIIESTRIAPGDNYICTTDQKTFKLSSGCRGSIIDVIDNGICDDSCGSKPCKQYEVSNPFNGTCVIDYVDCLGTGVIYVLSPFETIIVCSTSSINYGCKGLNIIDMGDCI